ncbi:MAG: twin-arginine translocation signal domain-containing protein, partial [Gammaproteobacteria bacterium]
MKKQEDLTREQSEAPEGGLSRRRFMGAAAIAGVAGATGLGSAVMSREAFAAAAEEARNKYVIHPGELDEYYGFWSGGHSGEVRVLGVP